jgi:flagellum-specific peptidoglycan hydrolase FlgJ
MLLLWVIKTYRGKPMAEKTEIFNLYSPATAEQKSIYTAWCDYLSSIGVKFVRVVVAQLVLETGYLTSKVFKENHNGFGMKMHRRGKAKGIRNGHAYYESFKDSILDYLVYQQMILRLAKEQGYVIKTDEDYLWLLDHLPHCTNCRYAEDPNYVQKLREHMRLLQAL